MKKTILVSLISFCLGILLAGYIFVYLPEKDAPENYTDTGNGVSTSLYADPPAQSKVVLDFTEISDKVGPAVVVVEAEKVEKRRMMGFGDDLFDDFWRFFGTPRQDPKEEEYHYPSRGSGFLISSDGYILTNNHIVDKAVKVQVKTLNGEDFTAEIIGTDPLTDLALLKVKGKGLPYSELGDSAGLRPGEWVLAIGNPLGYEHTVTAGIVSAKGRQLGVAANAPIYQDFIQTDAAINPGNSGGPLVNTSGEVVGINSMISTTSGGNIGIGFAIPSNLAKKIVNQLKENGRVVRGYLGVRGIYDIDESLKEQLGLKSKNGALIQDVDPGTPAEKAGFKRYDVITEVDGRPVKDPNDLLFKIADIKPGTETEIKVVRDGKEKTLNVKIAEREPESEQAQEEGSGTDLGFEVLELTPRLASRYGYRTESGLLIRDVKRYSEADRKGLDTGDIILEADRKEVTKISDLEGILKGKEAGDSLMLLVRREGRGTSQDRIVILTIPE